MLLSLNWLKDFVQIPNSITAEKLAEALTNHTVEIKSVTRQAKKYQGIVVGKILELKKHPSAGKLQLVKIDLGKKQLNIVCGATNLEIGQLVPVAQVGTILPNGLVIEKIEIRGEKSQGMLCAEDELGLGPDHSGIMILKPSKVGQNLADWLNITDTIFEVDNKTITYRADLWSHYGLAREIAAFLKTKFKDYQPNKKILAPATGKLKLKVKVEDFSLCPRYQAIGLENIKIEASPKWLQDRLIAVGQRPINNIVDVTNYVMLELGQPLHAFDQNKVGQIIVRPSRAGEKIETLDGVTRQLQAGMLVIADGKKPMAIAGIMGGTESEISQVTSSIILEAANFNFLSIRKTAQKLGLRTESSMRFEKALDPNLTEIGLTRAVQLIKNFCPQAKIVSNLVDEKKFSQNLGPITLDLSWLEARLGSNLSASHVKEILQNLGFTVAEARTNKNSTKIFKVTIPTWRAGRDISLPEDLVEEVGRIYSYGQLPAVLPKIEMTRPELNQTKIFERKIKNFLAFGAGLVEVYNYSFVSTEQLEKLKIDTSLALKLANPIASHLTQLRPTLVINLLENLKINQAREKTIKIFEIGNIFLNSPGQISKDQSHQANLPFQEKHLALLVAADRLIEVFAQAKSIITYLFCQLGLAVSFEKTQNPPTWGQKQIAAEVVVDKKVIGQLAQLNEKIGQELGLKKTVVLAEINLPQLVKQAGQSTKKFQEFAKYPPVLRDLAFVVNEKILYNDIKQEIFDFSPLIKQVELFDVYQSEKLGKGKKNLAFSLTFQADRTFTSAEIDKLQQALAKKLEKKFSAKIRDF